VWKPPYTAKFVDSSGAYVKYMAGEWTAYTLV
jgi:hypothetical protein